MKDLVKLFDALEGKFGFLEGDINWEGIQNVALNLRGQQLFIDYYENPDLVRKLVDLIASTIIQFLNFLDAKTGTTSISVNRIVRRDDARLHLHSNCTVALISKEMYREFLLPYDRMLCAKF